MVDLDYIIYKIILQTKIKENLKFFRKFSKIFIFSYLEQYPSNIQVAKTQICIALSLEDKKKTRDKIARLQANCF